MEPFRVIHVFGKMDRAGAETFIMNLYRHIDKSKIQFDFLVYKKGDGEYDQEIKNLGGKIYKVPELKIFNYLKFSEEVSKVLMKGDYKIIHSHVDAMSTLPLKIASECSIPFRIAHSHTTRMPRTLRSIVKYGSKLFINCFATHRFACTHSSYNWLFGRKKFDSNSKIINNGIDTEKFKFDKELRIKVRHELGVENKFVIGCVGKFTTTKNQSFLIDVFNHVQKDYPDSILILIGDGVLRKVLEEKVSNLSINDKVKFLGIREDVNDIMQAIDVLVHPSLYEGLPLTLVEAQTAGIKCIVSKGVSSDVKLTELIEFVGLDQPVDKWAKKVLEFRNYKRIDMSKEIAAKGYNIRKSAKVLEEIYSSMYGSK